MDARTRRRVETESESSAAGALLLAQMLSGNGGTGRNDDPRAKARMIAELLKRGK